MRLSRLRGAWSAAALLAAIPAYCQTAPSSSPALTPPGSTTPVPLLPMPGTAPTGGAMAPALPAPAVGGGMTPAMPMTPTMPMTPPAGLTFPGMGGQGMSGMDQGTSLSDLFSGTSALPTTMTLGQLNSNWRRMTITGSLDFGTLTQVVSSLLGSAGIGVYYTQGQTVNVGSVTYLVAYRAQPKSLNVAALVQAFQSTAMSGQAPPPEKLTPQTPLALTLLNLQSAGSLTDIRPFNMQKELADSAAAASAYNTMVKAYQTLTTPAMPTQPSAKPKPPL